MTGANLSGATVTIGGNVATVTGTTATTATFLTPAHAAGAVDVTVTTAGGSATSTNGYTYVAAPTIANITPSSGPAAGGQSVTITGTDLSGATSVTFGGTAGAITANSATSITVTPPPHAAGAVDVVVTTAGGSSTVTNVYTYQAPPTIANITPNAGPTAGGQSVTVTGTNLSGATVSIGGNVATVTGTTATTATFSTPAHAAGAVDVTVTTAGGSATSTNGYTYVAAPTIANIAPSSGPSAGGQSVTITGTDLSGATSVTFGAAAGAITASSAVSITVTTTAHPPGAVDVVVTTVGGTSTATNVYTYEAPPTIADITPNAGSTAGGQSVTVTGANLSGATITIGGSEATVTGNTATTATFLTPAHAAGAVVVTVTTASGSATLLNGFTFVCPPGAATITPSGPITFCSGGSVTLTASAGASYQWSTGATTQSITATTSGTYSVTVTDANGCSYSASQVVTVNPVPVVSIAGPAAICAGDSVTLDAGAGFASYSWSNGVTTQTITVSPTATTTFEITVTNADGCTSKSSKTVTVNPLPQIPVISSSPGAGGAVMLTSTLAHSYLWSTNEVTASISVARSGSYSVTVRNGQGCSATSATVEAAVAPAGRNVSVSSNEVTATFRNVTAGGAFAVTRIDPVSAGVLPAGYFQLDGGGLAFEISTGISYSGTIELAFHVPTVNDRRLFRALRVMHSVKVLDANGQPVMDPATGLPKMQLVDRTSGFDFNRRLLFARVTSLSPFVIARVTRPTLDDITAPVGPVAAGTAVNVSVDFTDPDASTPYRAVWSWGDGTTSDGVVTAIDGEGSVSASHVYAAAGLYVISVRLTDGSGESETASLYPMIVFDPEGGSLTGQGKLDSAAGTYLPEPGVMGRTDFHFRSEYKKGATTPSGEITLRLHNAPSKPEFESTHQEWLVVSRSIAYVRGSGTLDDSGSYEFLLIAVDGDLSGGGGKDRLRFRIWNAATGDVIYDNMRFAPDDFDAARTQPLDQGEIRIRKK